MSSVKTSVTELPESRVRLQAEVPAEEVERRVAEAATQLGRQMRVPGFRKGKVPPPIVIRRLGREAVLDEALRARLGSWYSDAIEEAGIAPVGQPELDVSTLPGEGEPLSFSIEIGVRPVAKLGRYEGLEGAAAGDERTVEVTFPEDYQAQELAGRTARFDVKVSEVKSKRLPELDDDFATEAGGFDTLAELREDMATRLRENDELAIEREFEQAVLDAAVEEAEVDVPEKLIH